jgi:MFS family permease
MATSEPLTPEGRVAQLTKSPGGTFAALSVPHYARLWSVGFVWNVTRWMSVFLCTYLVNQLTHSPLLVQAVGAAFFAPMFLTGALGGVISDRLDRRRTMLILLCLLIPAAGTVAAVNLAGAMRAWMAYPFMLVIGFSMVVDMTGRRALVYDLVGREQITNALALESLAMTGGTLLGGLGAGTIVSLLGVGQAFVLVTVAYVLSLAILRGVPPAAGRKPPGATDRPNVLQDVRAAFGYVRGHRALVSILGVTVIMNLFYHSFIPLIPVFADRLDVSAFWTGVLASAPALGSITGAFFIARGLGIGRGRAYVGGSAFALVFLCLFAASDLYPLALVALVLAGLGISGFATMQSALVMMTASDEMRGRAMGLLSMAIGVLPFSMLALGAVAQVAGPSAGVIANASIGLVLIAVWSASRPEAHRIA